MKKGFLALLLCLPLLLAACGDTQAPPPVSGGASALSEISTPEEDTGAAPLIVWTEPDSSRGVARLSKLLEKNEPGLSVEVVALPEYDDANRDEELKRLRTELLAGKGPDLFLLTEHQIGDSASSFFPAAEKTMRTGVFQNLGPYFQADPELAEDNFIAPVFNAGVVDGKRYVVPLQYGYDYYYADDDDSLTAAGLSEADFAGDFAAYAKAAASSEKGAARLGQFDFIGVYPCFSGSPFDYTAGTFSADPKTFRALLELETAAGKSFQILGGNSLPTGIRSGRGYSDMPPDGLGCIGLPIRNDAGKITPRVTAYAAVYAGSKRTEDALKLVKLLLSETLQRGEELIVDGEYYSYEILDEAGIRQVASLITFDSGFGLPVRKGCCQNEILAAWESELDTAVFQSEGDQMLARYLGQCFEAGRQGETPDYDAIMEKAAQELGKYAAE